MGAAVVVDPELPGPGVITERDILHSVGAGLDPDAERVADHLTAKLTFASPDWSLEQAAATMVRGGFRHLIVVEGGELAGILSMRDIVRVWTGDGASCELPRRAARRRAAAAAGTTSGRECEWCSSGSCSMSRRVSRIHITVVTTKMIAPTADRISVIVVPTIISVIPTADISGISVGPGR